MGEEVKRAHEEPEEAFKLFMTAYNARQRKERKTRQEAAPIEVKQKGRTIENTIQGGVGSINQKVHKVVNNIMPEAGTIGANEGLYIAVEREAEKLASAMARGRDKKSFFGKIWKDFKNHFGVGKVSYVRWIKSQKEEKAYEFIAYFKSLYDTKTVKGSIDKSHIIGAAKTHTRCHIDRRNLMEKLGWKDEDFYDFLEKITGERTTGKISTPQYNDVLLQMERKLKYEG